MKITLNQYSMLFFLLCGIGILLHLLLLNIPLYDDGGGQVIALTYHDSLWSNFAIAPHGFLDMIPFAIGARIFGISEIALYGNLFLINILYLVILYLCTYKMIDKETAVYVIIIHLFTFYAWYNSFILVSDGVIFSLLSTIIIFSLYFFLQNDRSKYFHINPQIWFCVSILAFMVLIAMKHRTLLFILPLFLYSWYSTRHFMKAVSYALVYLGSVLLVIGGTVLLFYYVYDGDTASALLHLIFFSHNFVQPEILSKVLHPATFVNFIVAMTPLFLFLPLLTFKEWKKYVVCYCWLTMFCLYFILIPYDMPFVKYFVGFLLPPLTILSAAGIRNSIKNKSPDIFYVFVIGGVLLVSAVLVYINNTLPNDYWFFLDAMGPVIKVWQPILITIYVLCFVLFISLLFIKSLRTSALAFFLILSLSFNIMMLTDPLVDTTHRNLINDLLKYEQLHKGDEGLLYSWNEDIAYYWENRGFYVRSENERDLGGKRVYNNSILRAYDRSTGLGEQGYIDLDASLESIAYYVTHKGGTVVFLNFPEKYVVDADEVHQEKIAYINATCHQELKSVYKTGSLLIYRC